MRYLALAGRTGVMEGPCGARGEEEQVVGDYLQVVLQLLQVDAGLFQIIFIVHHLMFSSKKCSAFSNIILSDTRRLMPWSTM